MQLRDARSTGIVDTPSDFGGNGSRPTHPELIDWLADEFVKSGWSIKHLQQLILTSATFQQSSAPRTDAAAIDADGRYLWRFTPRRLEAEAIRDSMLAVSGALDLKMGGPGFYLMDVIEENVMHYFPKEKYTSADFRRMVYLFRVRAAQDGVFGSFDCPDGGSVSRHHLERFPGDSELAARMQLSVPEVADISSESAHILKMYGADQAGNPVKDLKAAYARNCILARRLAEKGVRFVQLFNGASQPGGEGVSNWDGHKVLAEQYVKHGEVMDQPTAALLTDLKQRGLLDDTLVVWCTEFGRMPTFQKGASGRDHNPAGFTAFLAGAGVKCGFSSGATDEFGCKAVENVASVHDFHATILDLLGRNHERLSFYHNGIERRLTDVHGHVIKDALAIYNTVTRLIADRAHAPVPQALLDLAAITDFDVFITTTFDGFLTKALTQTRPGWSPAKGRAVLHPTSVVDVPQPLPGTFLYHILGATDQHASFAIWEEDYMEYLAALLMGPQDNLKNLISLLRNRSLLLIGSPFRNWFVRFFLFIAKRSGIAVRNDTTGAYFAEMRPEDDPLVFYFDKVIGSPRVLPIDPCAFVSELRQRWQNKFTRTPHDLIASLPTDMPRGYVFISYASEDQEAAFTLGRILQRFYAFAPATQQAQWAGGTGFIGAPPAISAARLDRAALLADVQQATKENRWHRVDLRLRQLGKTDDPALEQLLAARAAFAREGQPFTNAEGMSLRWCPPTGPQGFLMGSPETEKERSSYETQHKVTLTTGFWLSQYEVMQAEWTAVMGSNPSTNISSDSQAPVENISWLEAVEFCRRLTDRERARGTLPPGWEYALPSEAQWEYACRAGTSTAYSFGDDPALLHLHGNYNDKSANFTDSNMTQDDGFKYTAPVGSYKEKETKPNAWGFYDMHGNVFEWCADALDPNAADYGTDVASDPLAAC